MEGSAATAPSSSTAASDSAPATPASVEQLDKGQVSGPLGRGTRKAGWLGACETRGAGAGFAPPRAPPEFGESHWVALRSACPLLPARGEAPADPQPCGLDPQVDCRGSLGFRGATHLALLLFPLAWPGRLILQASVTLGLRGPLMASAPPRDQRRQGL